MTNEEMKKVKSTKDIDDGTLLGMFIMMEGEVLERGLIKTKSESTVKGMKLLLETMMDALKDRK